MILFSTIFKHIFQTHYEAAEKLLGLCRANKGVFVKVGQHIGALEFLVPTEYVNTMKVLHSQAPSSPLRDVFDIIREELKQEVLIFSI